MKKQATFDVDVKNAGRIAVYSRVSTRSQDNEAQDRALREYLKAKSLKGAEWFREKISGAKERRAERDRLLSLCRQGKIDTVIVWKLARWGRSTADTLTTLKELSELNVRFVSLMEAIDLGTAYGRAMAGMLAVFAELDREYIKDQMWSGRLKYKEKNGNMGGRRPRAMEKAPEVIALKEQKGWGVSKLAQHLGISPSSVRRILKAHNGE